MLVQPIMAHCPVVPLGIAVLMRFAGLDMHDADSSFYGPVLKRAAYVFRPVVATDFFGTAAPLNNVFQGADDTFRRQRKIESIYIKIDL